MIRGCLGDVRPEHRGVDGLQGRGQLPTMSELDASPPPNKQGVGTADPQPSLSCSCLAFSAGRPQTDCRSCSPLTDLGGS